MSIRKIINQCAELGIKLSSKEGHLKVDAPKGAMTQSLLAQIKEHKQGLLEFLKEHTSGAHKHELKNAYPDVKQAALSSGQSQMWFLDNVHQSSDTYHFYRVLHIDGAVSIPMLEAAFNEVVVRHSILRTNYFEVDETLQQVIQESSNFKLEAINLSAENESSTAVTQAQADFKRCGFDLKQDCMLKALLIKLNDESYQLHIKMHHIASDGWSVGVIVKELSDFYDMLLSEARTLPGMPYQYIDYAIWQQSEETQQDIKDNVSFFKEYLKEAPSVHSLPVNSQARTGLSKATTLVRKLSKEMSEAINAFCQLHRITQFSFLQFCISFVLSRYSNNNDIVMGVPVANRTQQELSDVVGYFVNTLPIRTKIQGDTQVLAALQAHNLNVLSVLEKQNAPFDEIVQQSVVERFDAISPLVQVLFSLQNNDIPELNLGDAKIKVASPHANFTELDLDIECLEENQQLVVNWTFAQGLFSPTLIESIAKSFETTLTTMMSANTRPLREIVTQPTETLQYLTSVLNDTGVMYPQEACIHTMFEAQVLAHPDRIAVEHDGQTLTYRELNEKANQVAHYLREKHGVQPDTLVGICIERSLEMAIGVMGILKAGGAYVPLDPTYPPERLNYLLDDAQLHVVLSQTTLAETLAHFSGVLVALDGIAKTDTHFCSVYCCENIAPNNIGLTASHMAYVIYTSGSTGKPKGVMVEHGSVVNYQEHVKSAYGLSEKDHVLQFSSISFDIFVEEYFGALCQGARLVLRDEGCQLGLGAFAAFCDKHDISIVSLPTAFWAQLVADPTAVSCAKLRTVIVGGEALSINTVTQHQNHFGAKVALINSYGPTEGTVTATSHKVSEKDALSHSITIGKANINNQLFVLDQDNELTPLGGIGELHIGGEGVARGYLNQPALTAERFIAHPLAKPDARSCKLYKTGDLVRYLDDGCLEFIGRKDDQVKIRGFRVEIGEIETHLSQLEGVDSAVVLVKENDGSKQLVGYVRAQHESSFSSDSDFIARVRAQLSEQLPEYMIPGMVMVVLNWPLTSHGKIDKKALPEPDTASLYNEYVAPNNEVEVQLADIWADLLNLDVNTVSTTANFFELGGHSLLSIRLVSEVRAKCGVEISLQDIFENATIAQLAEVVSNSGEVTSYPPMTVVAREERSYPVSFSQQRLWFIDNLKGGTPEYNMPIAFNVRGRFDIAAAEQAFLTILSRHEVLRTVYEVQAGQARQRVMDVSELQFKLQQADFSDLTGEMLASAIQQFVETDATVAFDLQQDTMLRACYIKESDTSGMLVFNMHHIASDGWSTEVVLKEFTELYQAYKEGRAYALAPLKFQYIDFTQWQRAYLTGDILETQIDYWTEQLAELPVVHSVPLDYARPATKQHAGAIVNGHIAGDVADKLLAVARKHQLTPFMLLHGALSLLLARHSNSHDIVIGTPVANRLEESLEPLIGFFVNTLVLRVDTEYEKLSDYFAHVKSVHLAAQSNQDIPFEQLVERLKVPRSAAHSPLFQIMMTTNTQYGVSEDGGSDSDVIQLPDVELTPYESNFIQSKFDLEVDLNISDAGLDINWNYDTNLFTQAHIEQLNTHLCRMLTELSLIGQALETAPHSLAILSSEEAQQQLFALNDTAKTYSTDVCMQQLFEAQVAAHPDNVAVSFEGQELTYKALNEKANQVAHTLRAEYDVKPDTLVGLCTERSLEMVIGILGILKAGGAYVPLDPSYPPERIGYLLEDANLDVVLTHSQVSSVMSQFSGDIILLDGLGTSESHAFSKAGNTNIRIADIGLTAQHLAYVIYTSGSTGKPKGVMVEHQALHNRIEWMHSQYGLNAHDKILQKTPYSFDVSVWEFIWTLCYGAQLVVAKPEGHKDPEYLCALINQAQITKLHFVPSMLGVILQSAAFRQCHSIQQVFCSGEALQQGHVTLFRSTLPDAELHNLYGPTEAAIDVSYWDCAGDISQSVPIGKPIDNIQLLILDANMNIVPLGAVGELHIGGDGLARGYLNKTQLTAERFIENPYYSDLVANSSPRLYKTGDLARVRFDGEIEYQGRTDHQVKIRGLRIELGEIEHQIGGLNNVDSALVTTTEQAGTVQLVAYIKQGQKLEEDHSHYIKELKRELAKAVPIYMVPEIIIVVDEWPLTANGKVNRSALPAPDSNLLQVKYVAPQTQAEHVLVNVWSELLNIPTDRVSTSANFFELGGHSLLVPSMLTQMSQLGYQLAAADVYNAQTLSAIAELAGHSVAQASQYSPVSLVPSGATKLTPDMFDLVDLNETNLAQAVQGVDGGISNVKDILPLLTLQQGFLFQHLANPDLDPYWQSIYMQVKEDKLDEFIAALNTVIQRYDTLRSVYKSMYPIPVSVILNEYALRVDYHRLSDNDAYVTQMEDLTHDMSIDKLPPILLVVGKTKTNVCHVKLMTHHLMLDQVGAAIVLEEVKTILANGLKALTKPVPHRSIVAYLSKIADYDVAKRFFEEALQGVNKTTSVAGITQDTFSQEINTRELYIDTAITEQVRAISQQSNTSPAVFFHTAFAMLMSILSNQRDVVFGSVFSGRQSAPAGSEKAVGMFMNTLPFRVKFSGDDAHVLFESVKESLMGYLAHEHFPMNHAKQLTELGSSDALINALFNFRRGFDTEHNTDVIEQISDADKMGASSPLILAVTDNGDDFHVTVKADNRLSTDAIVNLFKLALLDLSNGLLNKEKTTSLLSKLAGMPSKALWKQHKDQRAEQVDDTSFVAKELKKIWTQVFQIDSEQIEVKTSFWDCAKCLHISEYVEALNARFGIQVDRKSVLTNHTFEQMISYTTNMFVSRSMKEKQNKSNIKKCGVI